MAASGADAFIRYTHYAMRVALEMAVMPVYSALCHGMRCDGDAGAGLQLLRTAGRLNANPAVACDGGFAHRTYLLALLWSTGFFVFAHSVSYAAFLRNERRPGSR